MITRLDPAFRLLVSIVVVACLSACSGPVRMPLVIAHRGASGHLPEHTLSAYAAAYFADADIIEPDVVATRDGELVCFHDHTLDRVTDVEQRYPDRARADGRWYVIDFDLDELRTLEVTGRDDAWRGHRIPTFDEMLMLVERLNVSTGQAVGVVPEIKKPEFHRQEGFDLASATLETLRARGWTSSSAMIQCFDHEALRRLDEELACEYPLLALSSSTRSSEELRDIAGFADGVGFSRKAIDEDPSAVRRARSAGLLVYAYTYKSDPQSIREARDTHGLDAIFADYPDLAHEFLRRDR